MIILSFQQAANWEEVKELIKNLEMVKSEKGGIYSKYNDTFAFSNQEEKI